MGDYIFIFPFLISHSESSEICIESYEMDAQGNLLICEWTPEGTVLISEWTPKGTVLISEWTPKGTLLISEWTPKGTVLISEWTPKGTVLISEWTPKGTVLISEWLPKSTFFICHPAGTSVNSVNYGLCSKFCLVHYNVSQWEFEISYCFSSTIIFIQNILL